MSKPSGNNWLLNIAINEYQDSNIPNLQNPILDAERFETVLKEHYGFSDERTIQCFNERATREKIIGAFDELVEKLGKTDNLIIYYAGHGRLDKVRDRGFWQPFDTRPGKSASEIRNETIVDYLKDFSCKHILLISDSCFSGAFFRAKRGDKTFDRVEDPYKAFNIPSRWIFSSGRIEEALDGQPGKGSPFSQYLIKYLKESEGTLLLSELGHKVKLATHAHTETYQTPRAEPLQIKGHEGGEFIFSNKGIISSKARAENKSKGKKKPKASKKETPKRNPELLNKLGIRFIHVPGGTFIMGDENNVDAKPTHQVTLSSFYMSEWPITQRQWETLTGEEYISYWGSIFNINDKCPDCPVERISWNDAHRFMNILSDKTGEKYRLPTEAEWEYAARGGPYSKGTKYAGNDNISRVGWYRKPWRIPLKKLRTHPVFEKEPNELGFYDMTGNVWEWCQDNYRQYNNEPKVNPVGRDPLGSRVVRGGSWKDLPRDCTITQRGAYHKEARYPYIGFRICKD